MSSIGGLGMGLVWGWLLILVGSNHSPSRRLVLNVLALGLASLLIALQQLWLANVETLIFFVAASAFAFIMHLAWRRSLRGS